MVNKYLKGPEESYLNALIKEGIPKNVIETIVKDLVSLAEKGNLSLELASALNLLTINSNICRSSFKMCEEVLCISSRTEVRVLKNVIDELVSIKGFEKLIPEVGSNIAYDPLYTRDPNRMVAIDGRIVRGSKGVYIAGEVKVGGSRHTAKILALLQALCPELRVALVIANNDLIQKAVKKCKLSFIETGPHKASEDVERKIFESVEAATNACRLDIILDRGGEGLEPVSYLLAKDLEELIEKVRCIAGKLS
jgi:predicted fused transcriptional regulator/phosphomethylpyrimidine kinase